MLSFFIHCSTEEKELSGLSKQKPYCLLVPWRSDMQAAVRRTKLEMKPGLACIKYLKIGMLILVKFILSTTKYSALWFFEVWYRYSDRYHNILNLNNLLGCKEQGLLILQWESRCCFLLNTKWSKYSGFNKPGCEFRWGKQSKQNTCMGSCLQEELLLGEERISVSTWGG